MSHKEKKQSVGVVIAVGYSQRPKLCEIEHSSKRYFLHCVQYSNVAHGIP